MAPSNAYSVGQKYSALDNKIASAADESDVQMIFLGAKVAGVPLLFYLGLTPERAKTLRSLRGKNGATATGMMTETKNGKRNAAR